MATATPPPAPPPPPPAPPPPPVVHGPQKILAHSKREPANRNNVGSVRPTQASNRSPFADIHPETLQHAAASLRKTQYNQPFSSYFADPLLGREDRVSPGRHWTDQPQYAGMAEHQAGAALYAPSNGAYQHMPVGVQPQQSYSLNSSSTYSTVPNSHQTIFQPQQIRTSSISSFSTYTNPNSNANFKTIPIQQQQPQQPNNYSSYSYVSQQPSYVSQQPTSDNFIHNPQQLIHDFATQTLIEPSSNGSSNNHQQQNFNSYSTMSTTTTNTNFVRPTLKSRGFAEELRDNTLTDRQKFSNQFQQPIVPERTPPRTFTHILQESKTMHNQRDEINELVNDLEWKMKTGFGAAGEDICTKCVQPILPEQPGVTALGKAYHVKCFTCDQCQKELAGCSFYALEGKNLCQVDYMNTLEKCDKCAMPITQKILRAIGKAFHPECFNCHECTKSLDGIPFTLDKEGLAYCIGCYHEKFSPRCAACLKAIIPKENETEVARVVAMDRSYHIECYKCEDCHMQLNSKIEGQGCYPLEGHLFCKQCNLNHLKAMINK